MRVTLVIHGTFAADGSWWRLGAGGAGTFADRLEAALAQRHTSGTVWRPALEAGMNYEDFSWTGANRDSDRRAGARKLRGSLADLASRLDATPEQPLTVNLVAHSHGGNVALAALDKLPATVRIGRVVLLGTPLIVRRPALRVFRLVLAWALLALVFVLPLLLLARLVGLDVGRGLPVVGGFSVLELILFAVALTVFSGRLLQMFAAAADRLWRILFLQLLGDRAAYGPRPARLTRVLGGKPVVLFTSRYDEADLLLKLGAAPESLWLEWAREHEGRVWRAVKQLVSPIVVSFLLVALAYVLECVVLGFAWWRALFMDYDMAHLPSSRAYAAGGILHREDVSADLNAAERVRDASATMARPVLEAETRASGGDGLDRHAVALRETIAEVLNYTKRQVILRHSLYYKSPEVVERVAELLGD